MINQVIAKMNDYQAAGVKVVWQIFPEHHLVHVYTGDKLDEMQVCFGDSICFAAPTLDGFEVVAKDIFFMAPEDAATSTAG